MKAYEVQNGIMVQSVNGEFMLITEGQIQKGDLVLNNKMGLESLYKVVRIGKENAFVKGYDSKSDLAWEVIFNRDIEAQIQKENSFLKEIGRVDNTVKVFRKIA